MNEPRDLDDAIERIVRWRASRAQPTGLLRDIRIALEPVPQRRSLTMWSMSLSPAVRFLTIGAALVALLAALAAGAALVGSRPNLGVTQPPRQQSSTVVARSSVPGLFDCTARSLPASSSTIDLTGAWYDRANLYYLHQSGRTVWGVALNGPSATYSDVTQLGPFLALRGSILSGGTVKVDWGSAGDRYPGDGRFGTFAEKAGSLTWSIRKAPGGNVELVTTAESGDALSGPAYSLPTLVPCTPVVP